MDAESSLDIEKLRLLILKMPDPDTLPARIECGYAAYVAIRRQFRITGDIAMPAPLKGLRIELNDFYKRDLVRVIAVTGRVLQGFLIS